MQNIPLAIVLGVLASMGFALGATLQHSGIDRIFTPGSDRHLTFQRVLQMVRTPIWLLGTVLILAGAGLHLIGVTLAPVTVVQPVGILAVPFAVLLAARKNHSRPTRGMWLAIAMAVVGIVAFTLFSSRTAATETVIDLRMIFFASVTIWVGAAVFVVLGAKGAHGFRCLAWATAGAFLYGLATALMKTSIELFRQGRESPLMFWLTVAGLFACYAVGAWFIQQAYASGPAEIVVGSMTVIDPLIAVAFGIVVLGEGRNIDPLSAVGMVMMGALASWGVTLLSKYHPDAAKAFEQQIGPTPGHPKEGIPR
ncbi:hypothetical protein [Granulicoccus sp. GXG6511]|uniref:hypothetical protein n=1 Tax=Granulicoccus sp. GXG6511 TaxID=3381351 RepID=UPI003D7DB8CD